MNHKATSSALAGLTILVVEDEFLIADEIASVLSESGAHVVGPAGSVEEALQLIERGPPLDAAVLDVDLMGKKVFPVADILADRLTPCVFVTGYDSDVIPQRHRQAARITKPATGEEITAALIAVARKAGS
jgi:DNA-binding response OmpR family regulator